MCVSQNAESLRRKGVPPRNSGKDLSVVCNHYKEVGEEEKGTDELTCKQYWSPKRSGEF